jgi:hypothetical protein
MTWDHDRPILPLCRSRPVKRLAECVLRRGDGPDRVLGDVLLAYPAVTLCEAIADLSAQGW